ncbi:MAG: hypothetical protein M0R74_00855 [Dehalococcoidia bacterium]|nr:hypothetical protein [Dehalococcoidia bacterium]
MARMWRLWATVGVVAVVALAVAIGAVAMRGNKGDDAVSSPPGDGPQVATDSLLHQARLDLAKRLGLQPADVTITSIRAAGFNGCLGVLLPDQACTEQFIGGYIALFEANGQAYRYHFGDRFITTDFQPKDARIEDGLEVPNEIAPDLVSILAGYARHDAEIQADAAAGSAIVEALVPFECPPNANCAYATGRAQIAVAGETVFYELVAGGEPVTVLDDPTEWPGTAGEVAALQERLREDLAGRLKLDIAEVSVSTFRWVTWPDGCLGVEEPGKMCTQALVDGWLAKLTAGGKVYDYHGAGEGEAGSEWIAASFQPDAIVHNGTPRVR